MHQVNMRKSFKDSLKVLEADIQHANTLASDFPREYDGACLQMRMSYSPAAHLFLFLVQWTDCSLAGALGLLRILIYKVYVDGTTTMSTHERKASIREFYAVIFPSLLQLQRGLSDVEDRKQKAVCMERYGRRDDEERRQLSELDVEREEECGICMEMNSKIVLPNCGHAMCMKCYRKWQIAYCTWITICWCTNTLFGWELQFIWKVPSFSEVLFDCNEMQLPHLPPLDAPTDHQDALGSPKAVSAPIHDACKNRHTRSQSCPFCRDSLKRVNSCDLWILTDNCEIVDTATLSRENLRRLFIYIDKLPLIVPDSVFDAYDSHIK